jgi:hypothetical protein
MRQLTLFMAWVAVIPMTTPPALVASGTAAAAPPGVSAGAQIPLNAVFRRCDFSAAQYVSPTGTGSGKAVISTSGSGTVVAQVNLATADPNTRYDVRLVQAPLPSSVRCAAGDAATAVGVLVTDATGTGAVTVQAPIRPGATGAWVAVERPDPRSQTPAEFYTSEAIAGI